MSIKHTRQTVTLRFPKEVVNRAKKIAELEKRSLNNWILVQIQKEIDYQQLDFMILEHPQNIFTPSEKNLPDKNLEEWAEM